MQQSPQDKNQVWVRDAILILFMLLNTYLIINGQQQLDNGILAVKAEAAQCQVVYPQQR